MKHLIWQTKKKTILMAILIAISAISVLLLSHKKQEDDMLPVRLSAIQTAKGWGYEIFVDEKVFIKQESVPAIGGNKPFRDKDQALAVGNLAVKKIVNGKMPAITIDELKALKVLE